MSLPAISVTGIQGDLLSWRCDSGCWFPEPEMSWLDSDGNIITAGPSVTEKPSDHCYVVQRTVTVATTVHVTCRVHLPHINHTVEIPSLKAGNVHFHHSLTFQRNKPGVPPHENKIKHLSYYEYYLLNLISTTVLSLSLFFRGCQSNRAPNSHSTRTDCIDCNSSGNITITAIDLL